jgi:predicted signal transduction protein with EAL and GGDEF domain
MTAILDDATLFQSWAAFTHYISLRTSTLLWHAAIAGVWGLIAARYDATKVRRLGAVVIAAVMATAIAYGGYTVAFSGGKLPTFFALRTMMELVIIVLSYMIAYRIFSQGRGSVVGDNDGRRR